MSKTAQLVNGYVEVVSFVEPVVPLGLSDAH